MELKDRLKQARKFANLTQAEVVARIDNLSQPAYSQLEQGKVKSSAKMVELANLFGVNPTWLATGQGEPNATLVDKSINTWEKGDTPPDGMIAIDFLPNIKASLGNGYINEANTEISQLWFNQETLNKCNVNPQYAQAIYVTGDSMTPELNDGQVIAIDTSAIRIFDGEIYAFRKGDEIKVKYLFKWADGFKAVSRNDDKLRYPDETYTAKEIEAQNIEILGQFWWKSETRRIKR